MEFAHIFKTEIFLAKITNELPEAQILVEGPTEEPGLGYLYLKKKTNKKILPSSLKTPYSYKDSLEVYF